MNSLFNIITLARVLLLYICMFKAVHGGGKGKVPVYMPIPIPIPMPMRGEPGKIHHHHHNNNNHHHNQQNDGEGEVKKIYLLQPMPRQQHQQHGQQQQNENNHEPFQQQHHQQIQSQAQQYQTGSKHGSDMKILPIVVIPPIAPMPPIQLPQSGAHANSPRMTLSPQFNNYLLSNSDQIDRRRMLRAKAGGHLSYQHPLSMYQDHKSFADYGGSGGGAMYRRDRLARMMMARQASESGAGGQRMTFEHMPRARVSIQEDFGIASGGGGATGDDYDFSPSSWRPSRSSLASSSRRSRSKGATNSIRDIIDMPGTVSFDDDIPSASSSLDLGETRDMRAYQRATATGSRSLVVNGRRINLDNLDRDLAFDHDYIDNQPMLKSASRNLVAADGGAAQKAYPDNTIFYDRDYQLSPDEPAGAGRLSIKYTSNGLGSSAVTEQMNKRLYTEEKEPMEEEEWRLDSIMNINHSNPIVNSTSIDFKIKNNHTIGNKQNSTTTLIPPNSLQIKTKG